MNRYTSSTRLTIQTTIRMLRIESILGRHMHLFEMEGFGSSRFLASGNLLVGGASPKHCMQPTHQPVIKFAYANLSPVWRTADAGSSAASERSDAVQTTDWGTY